MIEVCCPHCGEVIDTRPDPGDGSSQEYIEDCAVCCRPIRFRAQFSDTERQYLVEAFADI